MRAVLVSLAAQNTKLGAFTIRAIEDRSGAAIGCFVYYAAPGRTRMFSISCRFRARRPACSVRCSATSSAPAMSRPAAVRNPALMAELGLQRWLVFRHRALAMALTRVPEVNDAVVRGDIYVGGLAGEEWSRLMHDFG